MVEQGPGVRRGSATAIGWPGTGQWPAAAETPPLRLSSFALGQISSQPPPASPCRSRRHGGGDQAPDQQQGRGARGPLPVESARDSCTSSKAPGLRRCCCHTRASMRRTRIHRSGRAWPLPFDTMCSGMWAISTTPSAIRCGFLPTPEIHGRPPAPASCRRRLPPRTPLAR